jgi:hypothetical protein
MSLQKFKRVWTDERGGVHLSLRTQLDNAEVIERKTESADGRTVMTSKRYIASGRGDGLRFSVDVECSFTDTVAANEPRALEG